MSSKTDKQRLNQNGAELLTIKKLQSSEDIATYGSSEDVNSNLSLDPKGSSLSLHENGTCSMPNSPKISDKKKSPFKGIFKKGKKSKKDASKLEGDVSTNTLGGSTLSLSSSIDDRDGGVIRDETEVDVNLNNNVNCEADVSGSFDVSIGASLNDVSLSSETGFSSPRGSTVSIDEIEGGGIRNKARQG